MSLGLALAAGAAGAGGQSSSYGPFGDLDNAELSQALTMLQQTELELQNVEKGITRLFDRHDALTHYADKGADVIKSQALELAADLTDQGMQLEQAQEAVAGLESDSLTTENVGNEAWQTVTKAVKDMIEWASKKLDEAIQWATKLFNRYFGAFENLRGNWEKVLKSAEDKADQVLGDDKEREYTRSADYYYVGDKVLDAEKLAEFGPKLTKYVQEVIKTHKVEVKQPEKDDVLNGEGLIKPVDDLKKEFQCVDPKANFLTASVKDNDPYTMSSEELPGRVKIFAAHTETAADNNEFLSNVKNAKVSILPADSKQKAKDKAKVEFLTASKVVAIANEQIELMDNIIDLVRGRAMQKADKALRETSKKIKGWNKDVPGDDASLDVTNAYKYAVKLATAWVGYERRKFLSQPAALAAYARQYSGALLAVANDSLRAHSKP